MSLSCIFLSGPLQSKQSAWQAFIIIYKHITYVLLIYSCIILSNLHKCRAVQPTNVEFCTKAMLLFSEPVWSLWSPHHVGEPWCEIKVLTCPHTRSKPPPRGPSLTRCVTGVTRYVSTPSRNKRVLFNSSEEKRAVSDLSAREPSHHTEGTSGGPSTRSHASELQTHARFELHNFPCWASERERVREIPTVK